MALQTPTAGRTATPHRKGHQHTSSMGSLYEVLADLDENQLQYLIQEMSHTGHRNVSVSEALTTFEGQGPSAPPPMPTAEGVAPLATPVSEKRLSKSQVGKLRLHTAFQRAPSLRQQRRAQETRNADSSVQRVEIAKASEPAPTPEPTLQGLAPNNFTTPQRPSQQADVAEQGPLPPAPVPSVNGESSVGNRAQRTRATSQASARAYVRIPRPDFDLPAGITVAHLLQLLQEEYVSSSLEVPSPASSSPIYRLPSPLQLSPVSPISFPGTPRSRPLRRASSRFDLAMEAERNASGAEEIGLGMLEPRQITPISRKASIVGAPLTPQRSFEHSLKGDTPQNATPVIMEGIFDVLENY